MLEIIISIVAIVIGIANPIFLIYYTRKYNDRLTMEKHAVEVAEKRRIFAMKQVKAMVWTLASMNGWGSKFWTVYREKMKTIKEDNDIIDSIIIEEEENL